MSKFVLSLATVVLIALPATAQEALPQPVQVVATILQLAPDQIASLVTMIQQREQALRPLQQQLQMHQQAIGAALQSPAPDPQIVGRLLIEAHGIEQQIGSINGQAAAQFEQVLAPDQVERLHGIRAAAQVCPVVPAFSAVGLL